jgi:hypothetical protein
LIVSDPDDAPGPTSGPLPAPEPERLPGERLLRRRGPLPDGTVTSLHPSGVLVHRAAFSAVVLAGNRPVGAIWRDPAGLWRAAPVAAAALAVSGGAPDDDALEALEAWAPAFRRFADARERVLADIAGGGDGDTFSTPPGLGRREGGGGPDRGREHRRGEVVSLAARRGGGPRRR